MCSSTVFNTYTQQTKLPGEVIDYIIDFLHDDIDSLKTCALVARTWTPSAHFHVFRTWPIVCRPDTQGKTAAELLSWATSDAGTRVKSYITAVIVKATRSGRVFTHTFHIADLDLLLSRFTHIRFVTLRHVILQSRILSLSKPDNRTLARLSILSCRTFNSSFTPIGNLLCLFPNIDRLDFINTLCPWDERLEWYPWFTSLVSILRVREVHMQNRSTTDAGYEGLWRVLECADPPVPLRKLGLAVPRLPGHTPPFPRLLARYTSSLVDLRLDVLPNCLRPVCLPAHWAIPSLRDCTALETLRLSILTLCEGTDALVPPELRCAYFNTLHSDIQVLLAVPPQLRKVVLTVFHIGRLHSTPYSRVLHTLPTWHQLDEALVRLGNLKSVVCVVSTKRVGLDVKGQTDYLPSSLAEVSDRPYRILSTAETSEDEFGRLLVSGLPGLSDCGLLRVASMS